jgi:hypothetical protein
VRSQIHYGWRNARLSRDSQVLARDVNQAPQNLRPSKYLVLSSHPERIEWPIGGNTLSTYDSSWNSPGEKHNYGQGFRAVAAGAKQGVVPRKRAFRGNRCTGRAGEGER